MALCESCKYSRLVCGINYCDKFYAYIPQATSGCKNFKSKIDMETEETKEIKIEVPYGYEIDKDKSTFEKIIFKKVEKKLPMSWEDYCKSVNGDLYYACGTSILPHASLRSNISDFDDFGTEREARAFSALGKLIQLRDTWNYGWEPNWENGECKYVIYYSNNNVFEGLKVTNSYNTKNILAFPTAELRDKFLATFRDLIESARIFL